MLFLIYLFLFEKFKNHHIIIQKLQYTFLDGRVILSLILKNPLVISDLTDQSQEITDLIDNKWSRPISHGFNPSHIHFNSLCNDVLVEKIYRSK